MKKPVKQTVMAFEKRRELIHVAIPHPVHQLIVGLLRHSAVPSRPFIADYCPRKGRLRIFSSLHSLSTAACLVLPGRLFRSRLPPKLAVLPELEVHHEEGEHHDPFGQGVGVLAGVIAVVLAIVTISSHRAHAAAVMERSAANDQWSFYQAKRMKYHSVELGREIVGVLGAASPQAPAMLERYASELQRYDKESVGIQEKANEREAASKAAESRALRFDLGEGLLEIGLVMTSLYFVSRKRLFPIGGVLAAVLGAVIGASGYLAP